VIGAMLADRCALAKGKLSAGGIAAIGLNHNRSPWRALLTGATDDDLDELTTHARDERCRLAWLEALGAGGTAVVRLDQRLRLWLAKLEVACATRRKSSHLRALALLAGAGPRSPPRAQPRPWGYRGRRPLGSSPKRARRTSCARSLKATPSAAMSSPRDAAKSGNTAEIQLSI
jgi:pimeloyl-ACP methyl ester carboxylesterase